MKTKAARFSETSLTTDRSQEYNNLEELNIQQSRMLGKIQLLGTEISRKTTNCLKVDVPNFRTDYYKAHI